METWKLLLITLLSAVVLGCVIGIVTGKQQLKRARGNYRPLLSVKERIIYTLCLVAGGICIAAGLHFLSSGEDAAVGLENGGDVNSSIMGNGMTEGGIVEDGLTVNSAVTDDGEVAGGGTAADATIADSEAITDDSVAADDVTENAPVASKAVDTPATQTEVAVARAVG